MDLSEFKASLVYISVSDKPGLYSKKPVSKNNQNNKGQEPGRWLKELTCLLMNLTS